MRKAEMKVQHYQILRTEDPIKWFRDDAGIHVCLNDRWIDKVEIDMAIQKLPPKERTIIDMLYVKGIPPRKAMILLGVDRSTIWRREKRAMRHLVKILKKK